MNFYKTFHKKYLTHKIQYSKETQMSEIKEPIYNVETGKSPGMDGLPIEFYKEFFENIKYDKI